MTQRQRTLRKLLVAGAAVAALSRQQEALSGVPAQVERDKSREEPIPTPPPPTDGEVK